MMNFRDKQPIRTCVKKYANYKSYKPYLAKDFFNRCGYTDCSDFWFGGMNNFHIDHFKPWKKYPQNPLLKTDYQNLVYCCSYVNILKSDDLGTYLDPCNEDYNTHFQRDNIGAIIPITPVASYMHSKMKMYLCRYRLIWMLDNLEDRMHKLRTTIEKTGNLRARDLYIKLSFEYDDYKKYLRANQ